MSGVKAFYCIAVLNMYVRPVEPMLLGISITPTVLEISVHIPQKLNQHAVDSLKAQVSDINKKLESLRDSLMQYSMNISDVAAAKTSTSGALVCTPKSSYAAAVSKDLTIVVQSAVAQGATCL
jgi:hypothetical protein